MSPQEARIQELENQFPSASGMAFAVARQRAFDAGYSILLTENDAIYEVFPDGTKHFIKRIQPPTPVILGSTFTIQ